VNRRDSIHTRLGARYGMAPDAWSLLSQASVYDREVPRLCVFAVGSVLALTASATAFANSSRAARYCEKPNPNASLAVSPGVTCATAEAIKNALIGRCYSRKSCVAGGFRCIAYWDGRFDQPFSYTHYAICIHARSWVVWNGG
jgi:hypothetical protein